MQELLTLLAKTIHLQCRSDSVVYNIITVLSATAQFFARFAYSSRPGARSALEQAREVTVKQHKCVGWVNVMTMPNFVFKILEIIIYFTQQLFPSGL